MRRRRNRRVARAPRNHPPPERGSRPGVPAGGASPLRSPRPDGAPRRRLPFAAFPGLPARRVFTLVLTRFALPAAVYFGTAGTPGAAGPARTDLPEADLRRVRAVTAPTKDFSRPEAYERMAGGAATSLALLNANAFSHPSANLTFKGKRDFVATLRVPRSRSRNTAPVSRAI